MIRTLPWLETHLPGQSVRYLCVGSVVYLIDTGGFAALTVLYGADQFLIVNLLSKAVAATIGFVLHKKITFRRHQMDGIARQFCRYVALLLINLGISSLLLYAMIDSLAWPTIIGKVATEIVVTVIAFLASRIIVFRPVAGEVSVVIHRMGTR